MIPLVYLLFKQVIFKDYKEDTQEVVMTFNKQPLFKEWCMNRKQCVWQCYVKILTNRLKQLYILEKLISSGEISSKEEERLIKDE